jgi:hypothetical protein
MSSGRETHLLYLPVEISTIGGPPVDLRFYSAANPAFKVAVRRGGSNGDEKEGQAKAQENAPHQGAQAQKDDR